MRDRAVRTPCPHSTNRDEPRCSRVTVGEEIGKSPGHSFHGFTGVFHGNPNSSIASRMQRIVMRAGHCALLLLVGGCAAPNAAKTPINAPLRPNPAVAGFRRVLVAGFVPSGSDEFKLNEETARFLRME